MDEPASLGFKERLALLCEHDDAAFVWNDPTAPAWRVGHFAVVKMPDGRVPGQMHQMLPWVVVYVASRTVILDFATEERAWQLADEISTVCGDRLEHEPATPREFVAAVPDVIEWARMLASTRRDRPWDADQDRPFMRLAAFLDAKATGLPTGVLDPPRGAMGPEQWA